MTVIGTLRAACPGIAEVHCLSNTPETAQRVSGCPHHPIPQITGELTLRDKKSWSSISLTTALHHRALFPNILLQISLHTSHSFPRRLGINRLAQHYLAYWLFWFPIMKIQEMYLNDLLSLRKKMPFFLFVCLKNKEKLAFLSQRHYFLSYICTSLYTIFFTYTEKQMASFPALLRVPENLKYYRPWIISTTFRVTDRNYHYLYKHFKYLNQFLCIFFCFKNTIKNLLSWL